ncbi:hypothetical protein LWC33_25100 [Pseudonocardia sp. RS11V-5]|uniref:hypothetical protein n=1 Tax=Pseudonocardia terrae TaxID=2905831 RepID=UPI001E5EACAC|nr:hypothetical protein [Pseudonocardia terrae]MCE3554721.1 hypothetical protein [Pseudonocardia terrae]
MLADILERDRDDHTALTTREQAHLDAHSGMRHIDQLADGITLATTGRLDRYLDHLAAEDKLTPDQRHDLAADPALTSLALLLRTTELAGHEPAQVLEHAVTSHSLAGAHSPAQVLHHRIRTHLDGQLTPTIEDCTDLIPAGLDEEWQRWLAHRADDADTRRRELGTQTAEEASQWAVEALGPVPEDLLARSEWEHRAGWAALYRELADHDSQTDPLGAAPPAGLGEKAAIWRTAHAALDLPDFGAEEGELTDGQLRVRVAAMQREQEWAPDYVADELSDTHRQLERRRTDAQIWTARAEATDDPDDRRQLEQAAAQAEVESARLQDRLDELETTDEARSAWYAHTAVTRDKAERARAELAARGVDVDTSDDRVTAEDWLAAHHAEQSVEDQHREITETDIAAHHGPFEAAPAQVSRGDATAPPTLDTTRDAIARAQAALAEIEAQMALDAAHQQDEDQERAQQLAMWSANDSAQEAEGMDRALGL